MIRLGRQIDCCSPSYLLKTSKNQMKTNVTNEPSFLHMYYSLLRLNLRLKIFSRFLYPSLQPQICISFPTRPTGSSFACSVWRSVWARSCTRIRRTRFNPSHSLAANVTPALLPHGNGTKKPMVVVHVTFKIQKSQS